MFMFYEIYCELCNKRGLTPSGAAAKIGFNRASVTMWKNTGKAPKQELLVKIADFFDVTTDYLLGKGDENEKAPTDSGERSVSDDDIKFALFGGDGEITDAMYQEVKEFAALIKLRESMKKQKE
jgi:transcriptional regulator with XRE-family HTH domain